MVSLADITIPLSAQGHLRPVHVERDLVGVADLVELCFKDTLDPDGRSYLRQLRKAAQGSPVLQWALSAAEVVNGLPLAGYVWEEAGQIVGNLSLISMQNQGQRNYLIANVAVHPNFRGRGIARMLTSAGVEYTRRRDAQAVWLQVRHDNSSALHIYQSLGFIEQARRTTWVCDPAGTLSGKPPNGIKVTRRQDAHWPEQRKWLDELYPAELRWYMPVKWWLIRPGFWYRLRRFLSLEFSDQWSVERDKKLLAVLTSHHDGSHAATLWLAAPEEGEYDETAIETLLTAGRRSAGKRRPLSLNLPAGFAMTPIQSAGFRAQQTLLWMQIKFKP